MLNNPYANKNLNQYKNNEVLTATPEKLMIMLFDAAIQFLFKARKGIEDGSPADICNNVIGCQKILREFMKTIDLENGVSVGKSLFVFYDKLVKMLRLSYNKKEISSISKNVYSKESMGERYLQIYKKLLGDN